MARAALELFAGTAVIDDGVLKESYVLVRGEDFLHLVEVFEALGAACHSFQRVGLTFGFLGLEGFVLAVGFELLEGGFLCLG